jgi:hypothetical protein
MAVQVETLEACFDRSHRVRLLVLVVIALVAATAVMLHAPIPQPSGYHEFADQRLIWGIPNFWNVVSNAPFLVVGLMGMVALRETGEPLPLRAAYRCFFAGACLVAIGSAYYHFAPTDQSLVWDRLPMAVMFMAFFAIVVAEHISLRLGTALFGPLLALGVASVLYWYFTEAIGLGDLRPYIITQFLPVMLVPLILVFFSARSPHARLIWLVLGAYGLAKLFEVTDESIFSLTHVISGHTLKHPAAALGAYFFLLAVRRRYAPDSGAVG